MSRFPLAQLLVLTLSVGCGGGTVDPGESGPDADGQGEENAGNAAGDGSPDGANDPRDGSSAADGAEGDGEPGSDGEESQADGAEGDGGDDAPVGKACKRGVGYGYHSAADLTALSRSVGWWYNWTNEPDQGARGVFESLGVEYVPMVWNGSFDAVEVAARIPDASQTLLGFNEPNFFVQANMTPEEAAAAWPRVEQLAREKGLKIASPALNYCGGGCNETDPFVYLDKFFAACQGCQIDYLAVHWYACTGDALKWYLGEMARYKKPIWLTEFSCGDDADRSLEKQKRYMQESVAILEADPNVARYAWFAGRTDAIPNVDLLGADGQLTELGQLYLDLPAAACDR